MMEKITVAHYLLERENYTVASSFNGSFIGLREAREQSHISYRFCVFHSSSEIFPLFLPPRTVGIFDKLLIMTQNSFVTKTFIFFETEHLGLWTAADNQ